MNTLTIWGLVIVMTLLPLAIESATTTQKTTVAVAGGTKTQTTLLKTKAQPVSTTPQPTTYQTTAPPQKITKPDSQGYGKDHCKLCGSDLPSNIKKEGLDQSDVSSCMLVYGFSPAGISSTLFECACKTPYNGTGSNGIKCFDKDECSTNEDYCDNNAKCTNTIGGFTCQCEIGFHSDDEGKTCIDYDECKTNPKVCGVGGKCSDKDGGYDCACVDGFNKKDTGHVFNYDDGRSKEGPTCLNVNECVAEKGTICTMPGQKCEDLETRDKYRCVCEKGYNAVNGSGDNGCEDIDECWNEVSQEPSGICGINTKCKNRAGTHFCSCEANYHNLTVDGCSDIDECEGNYTCDEENRGLCSNTDGGYQCLCDNGYKLVNGKCVDIDECTNKTLNDCHEHARCTNLVKVKDGFEYRCDCKDGYKGNGTYCEDVDECASRTDDCHPDAECTNLFPHNATTNHEKFRCDCVRGYSGDGRNCSEIEGDTYSGYRQSRKALSEYLIRIQLHNEEVRGQRLDLEREMIERKCAYKDRRGEKGRAKREVLNIDIDKYSHGMEQRVIDKKYKNDKLENENRERAIACTVSLDTRY